MGSPNKPERATTEDSDHADSVEPELPDLTECCILSVEQIDTIPSSPLERCIISTADFLAYLL